MLNIYTKKQLVSVVIQNKILNTEFTSLKELIENSTLTIQITFIDIASINDTFVYLLDDYKKKLIISTNNKSLWYYLKKIGIDISLDHHRKNYKNFHSCLKAIAIGGSAGSLKNMAKIIENIPFCDVTIFVVMHILPDQKNKLVDIFSVNTSMAVIEASDGMQVKNSTIYIAPPDFHMVVEKGIIYTQKTPKVNFCRPSIDVTFNSLAKEYKDHLSVILTCGFLDDGSRALENIKKHLGTVLIQDPNSCEANEIPINGMLTKNYDFVFSIDDIINYLDSRLNLTIDLKARVESMIKQVQVKYGYDFTNYDMGSITRRVGLLMQELGIHHLNDLEELILNDHEVFEKLFEKLSINVSEFFRDINTFRFVLHNVFKIFQNRNHYLKIWCAASSKGQEAYSIAMALDELGLLEKSIIYATDINETVLNQAKNGIYSKEEYQQCCENIHKLSMKTDPKKWFDIKENYVVVNERLKKKVHFFSHNLASDGEINEFQVVFCRNVLIYFNELLQQRVLDLIYNSLEQNAVLVLGESEHITKVDKFEKIKSDFGVKAFKKLQKGDTLDS